MSDAVETELFKDDSRDQLNGGEKISGQFVVAGRDGAKVLNFVEEALDEIALAVERKIAIPFGLAVGFWGNHGCDFPLRKGDDSPPPCAVARRKDARRLSDNLKSSVIKACFYEPAVNRSYAEMAAHYDT